MAKRLPPFYTRLRFATAAISTWVLNLGMFGERFKAKGLCSPGFNCHGCPWASAACPVGALAYGSAMHAIPVFVLGSVLAVGAVTGRLVCGFACPFGFLQDLMHRIPSPKLRAPKWLRWGKYVALALLVFILPWMLGFVPSGYLSLAKPVVNKADGGKISVEMTVTNLGSEPVKDPQLRVVFQGIEEKKELSREEKAFAGVTVSPGQTMKLPVFLVENRLSEADLVVDSPQSVVQQRARWQLYYCKLCPNGTLTATIPALFAGSSSTPMMYRLAGISLRLSILAFFLLLMVVISRSFCHLFCPLGAMYAICAPYALSRMTIERAACIDCGICDKACPMHLNVREEVGGRECIACGDCMKVCPKSGISRVWGFGDKKSAAPVAEPERKHALNVLN